MEDILKNELFIEHLAKLLSNIESNAENQDQLKTNDHEEEDQTLMKSHIQTVETEGNEDEESSVLQVKVCENFEKMSYQIKNAFEVSDDICPEKENVDLSLKTRKSNDMFVSNTSNLRRVASKSAIKERKQQFIDAVIQKFNLNMKKKKQSKRHKMSTSSKSKLNILEKSLLTKVGLGLSEMEYFYIENDLKIMSRQRKNNFRFFGKVFGRKSDYYVIFGGKGVGLDGGKITEPSIKDQQKEKEPEGVGLNKYEVWVARHNRMVGSK
jgi:hypothetical protein